MPQSLCLDMHQSGLSLSIISILSLPHSGINLISSSALVAPSNKPDLVIEKNHCGVAMNVRGVLCLQQ